MIIIGNLENYKQYNYYINLEERHNIFELRGKIISMTLEVEESLNQIIFDFFYPKFSDRKVIDIFLKKIVFSFTFDKKIELYKDITKTERYKNKLSDYLEKKSFKESESEIKDYETYITYLFTLLRKIQKNRNFIAHGYDMSGGFQNLKKDEFILGNKMKLEKFDDKFSEEFSRDTFLAHLMLTMIRLGIED